MLNLTYHENDIGLKASWAFSATLHGKDSVDGNEVTMKSCTAHYLLTGAVARLFLSPENFFQYTKEINNQQVTKSDL